MSVTGLDFPERIARMLATFGAELVEVGAVIVSDAQLARTPGRTDKLKRTHGLARIGGGFAAGFDAPYGGVIDRGRKRNKAPYKVSRGGSSFEVKRRMLGSEFAPRGMNRGAVRELRRHWPEVISRAAARAEGLT